MWPSFFNSFFSPGFLDSKDPSLAFAVYGASQLNIFPIAVLDVTTADSNKEEMLLCFNGKLSDCILKPWIHTSTFRAALTVKATFDVKKFYAATNEKYKRKWRRNRLPGPYLCLQLPIILIFFFLKTDLVTTIYFLNLSQDMTLSWRIRSFNFRVWRVCKQLWLSQQEKAFDVEQTATCLWWVPTIGPFWKYNFPLMLYCIKC